ncbi:MAG: 4Fe-4S dicluster domain-containing protein [Alphaproteobacteria bacterium]|jgi:Fe-S-cluster-containing dehydrogenase component|nr:4Fe-4S dicluster domain-containing protein [Alphaproteobacteria bacterium]
MTSLPTTPSPKRLGLVIDLDTCVGCHACAVSCKEWNTGGNYAPLTDLNPYGKDVDGVWLNRVHGFEVETADDNTGAYGTNGGRTVYFPRSCLHCEDAPCVTVCPTGASFKRVEDGIVLVNEDKCIGCKLCSWACPYGAREFDTDGGVMKKCTLCIDRIYNENLEEVDRQPACVNACPSKARHFGDFNDPTSKVSQLTADRGGVELMPEMGLKPTNRYLPPRPSAQVGDGADLVDAPVGANSAGGPDGPDTGFLGWIDRVLSR